MKNSTYYGEIQTPVPGDDWKSLSDIERKYLVLSKLEYASFNFLSYISIVSTSVNGQIIVRFKKLLKTSQRSPLLLDLEEYLKISIDEALVVWLEPLGDKNSLRNLRGIEVKI